jgi:hypothetical protein
MLDAPFSYVGLTGRKSSDGKSNGAMNIAILMKEEEIA